FALLFTFDDDWVVSFVLGEEIRDLCAVEGDESKQAPDRDVASAAFNKRKERSGDSRSSRYLDERVSSLVPEQLQRLAELRSARASHLIAPASNRRLCRRRAHVARG